jgi:hypothetical protein
MYVRAHLKAAGGVIPGDLSLEYIPVFEPQDHGRIRGASARMLGLEDRGKGIRKKRGIPL